MKRKTKNKMVSVALIIIMVLFCARVASVFVWDRAPIVVTDTGGTGSTASDANEDNIPTYQEVYDRMIELKEQYPEGMTWNDSEPYGRDGEYEYYEFQGSAIKGARWLGVSGAAFAFKFSDELFGSLLARIIDRGNFAYEDIRVGDILRVNNMQFVIVWQVSADSITVVEGNYYGEVHWGREISIDDIDFLVTRYPEGYSEDTEQRL